MIRTSYHLPTELIPAENLKLWLRPWSEDHSTGNNYINDNFTLQFQAQPGTVTIEAGSNVIGGTGTNFTIQDQGKRIQISGQERWIEKVNSPTSATINTVWINEGPWTTSAADVAFSWGYLSTWKDKSGGNFDFSQDTPNRMPFLLLEKGMLRPYSPRNVDQAGQSLYNSTFDDSYLNGTSYSVFFSCIPTGYSVDNINNSLQVIFNHRYNYLNLVALGGTTSSLNFKGSWITNTQQNYHVSAIPVTNVLNQHIVGCGQVDSIERIVSITDLTGSLKVPFPENLIGAEPGVSARIFSTHQNGATYSFGLKGFINELIIVNTILSPTIIKDVLFYLNMNNKA